jgi:hypothetical protein
MAAGKVYNWVATIRDADHIIQAKVTSGGKVEELVKGFDRVSQADSWAALRLCEGASDWYATVEHSSMKVATVMSRDDAMAGVMGRKPGKGAPVMQSKGSYGGSLGFKPKCHETRVTFSHG